MEIRKSRRKPGVYAQWYEVFGKNSKGETCWFLIYKNQAKTYNQAVKFWNKTWGHNSKAFFIRNAQPFDNTLLIAC